MRALEYYILACCIILLLAYVMTDEPFEIQILRLWLRLRAFIGSARAADRTRPRHQ